MKILLQQYSYNIVVTFFSQTFQSQISIFFRVLSQALENTFLDFFLKSFRRPSDFFWVFEKWLSACVYIYIYTYMYMCVLLYLRFMQPCNIFQFGIHVISFMYLLLHLPSDNATLLLFVNWCVLSMEQIAIICKWLQLSVTCFDIFPLHATLLHLSVTRSLLPCVFCSSGKWLALIRKGNHFEREYYCSISAYQYVFENLIDCVRLKQKLNTP